MKLRYAIFILLLTLSQGLSAQDKVISEITNDTTYDDMFARLKKLYRKQKESASYQKYIQLRSSFFEKTKLYDSSLKGDSNAMLQWVRENIQSTGFRDFAEADVEWNAVRSALSKSTKDNSAYFEFVEKVFKLYPDMYAKAVHAVEMETLPVELRP